MPIKNFFVRVIVALTCIGEASSLIYALLRRGLAFARLTTASTKPVLASV